MENKLTENNEQFESEVHAFLVKGKDASDTGPLGENTELYAVANGMLIFPSEIYTRSEAGYKCGCDVCLDCKIAKAVRTDMKTFYDCTLAQAFERHSNYFKSVGLEHAKTKQEQTENLKDESLESELSSLLNRHSVDRDSNTPDYILAQFICGCLFAYKNATRERDRHNNSDKSPKSESVNFREFL